MSFSSSSNPVRGELDDDEFFDSETELPLVQILINNEEPSTLKTNATAKHMNTPTRPYTPIYAVQFKAKPNANQNRKAEPKADKPRSEKQTEETQDDGHETAGRVPTLNIPCAFYDGQ